MRTAAAKKRGKLRLTVNQAESKTENYVLIVKVRIKSNKGTKPKEFSLQKVWQILKAKPTASLWLGDMETGRE